MEIRILGVPVFEGCNIRGVEKGPKALRESDVFDALKNNFNVEYQEDIDMLVSEEDKMFDADKSVKYYDTLLDMNTKLCKVVYENTSKGYLSIILGGDHSYAVGSIAGTSMALNHNLGVVWLDAHSDINTPITSPSKNFHGMPLATSMYVGPKEMRSIGVDKRKVKPTDSFLVGVRSMDPGEVEFKDNQELNHYTVAFIRNRGTEIVANEIVSTLNKNGIDNIHLSVDLDVFSTDVTTAFNCHEPDGILLDEGVLFIKTLFASGRVKSMDFAEYNPDLDVDGSGLRVAKAIFDAVSDALVSID